MRAISILQGLLTPLIAIIATYIAWQQWKGNQLKLRMERYERRLHVYQEVVKMMQKCVNQQLREFADIFVFNASTAEAGFLFGPEIREYIDEITSHAVDLCTAKLEYRDFTQPVPEGYDHNKIVHEMDTQTRWFSHELTKSGAKNKFKEYLNIS